MVGPGSTPRLLPLDEPDARAVRALEGTRDHFGRALNVFATMAHQSDVLAGFARLGGAFFRGSIPPRERELIILRVAMRTRCSYEWAHHAVIAADGGVAAAEIARAGENTLAGWDSWERSPARRDGRALPARRDLG